MLYRPYGGMGSTLADAMERVVEVDGLAGLLKHLEEMHPPFGPAFNPAAIVFESYGYDDRIGWETWIVRSTDGWGVLGFTNEQPQK